jgi:hypothetical protein
MPHLDPLESVAATQLVSASLIASLVPMLLERGALTSEDTREIYEHALILIDTQQSSNQAVQEIYKAARKLIESNLGEATEKPFRSLEKL